jgi:type VI secretion system protein ImpH
MGFPASQIQDIVWKDGGAPEVLVNFMGLTGPLGVLPLYYTEYVVNRGRAKDTALRDFLDLFNHRIISLFYQAWEKYRFVVAYERGERDRFSQYLLDLIGLGTKGLQDRQAAPDDSLLYYSGLLAPHARSAASLEHLVADYFGVPVEVEQFAGGWYPMDEGTQCRFDAADTHSEQLGFGAVAGDEVWDPQSGARIKIGPVPLRQYLDFLPNGPAYGILKSITRFYGGGEVDFEVQLILLRDETPGCELGAEGDAAPQLGWCSWVRTVTIDRHPGDTILKL